MKHMHVYTYVNNHYGGMKAIGGLAVIVMVISIVTD